MNDTLQRYAADAVARHRDTAPLARALGEDLPAGRGRSWEVMARALESGDAVAAGRIAMPDKVSLTPIAGKVPVPLKPYQFWQDALRQAPETRLKIAPPPPRPIAGHIAASQCDKAQKQPPIAPIDSQNGMRQSHPALKCGQMMIAASKCQLVFLRAIRLEIEL